MTNTLFLTAKKPLVLKVADWLLSTTSGKPLDLSDAVVVLPTSGAARRLRYELVLAASAQCTGVLAPLMTSPIGLLRLAVEGPVAERRDCLLTWSQVLASADREAFEAIFSGFSGEIHPVAQLRMAQSFFDLGVLLAEADLTPASPEIARACAQEEERWRQIGELYRVYKTRLKRSGFSDPNEALREVVKNRLPLPGIRRVIVAGVPDLNRLVQRYLEGTKAEVTFLVDAPGNEDAQFDSCGRPSEEYWSKITVPMELEHITPLADPASEAETAMRMLDGDAGLCVVDPEAIPVMQRVLENHGVAAFNPEGKSLARFEAAVIARRWLTFCQSRQLSELRLLAENPQFLRLLCLEARVPSSVALEILDKIRTEFLIERLPDAGEFFASQEDEKLADGRSLVRAVATLLKHFDVASALDRMPVFLARLYKGRELPAHSEEAEALEALAAILEGFLKSPVALARPTAAAELFAMELEAVRIYGKHPEGAVELNGWLESSWLKEPALVLSGCVESALPASVNEHPFLPDSARRALGLQSNQERYARDIYLLHNLLQSHSVRLTLSRTGADGEPARPSRLLFRCPDDELPGRVRRLFGEATSLRRAFPAELSWQLEIPRREPPESVSVTGMRDYLACPLRFYLKNRLRMRAFDPEKAEMDASDFGTLLHSVVENFANDRVLRESEDFAVIEKFALAELDAILTATFGRSLPLPLRVQRESLRARLREFARLQVEEHKAGWRIQQGEFRFDGDSTLSMGGLPLIARLDRVDVHAQTGQRRILDYKTFTKIKTPEETHLKWGNGGAPFPEMEFERQGRTTRWADLQLPLYRALAAFRWPDDPAPPLVGYFLLPERIEESGIVSFELADADYDAALRCAEVVASRIKRGIFWPPAEEIPEWDDFTPLFLDADPTVVFNESSIAFLKGEPL